MELQLGLALPSNPIKGFDLNNFGYEAKEVAAVSKPIHYENKKRSFDQAFDEHNNNTSRSTAAVPRTLPLFLWNNNQPNHHDNDDDPDKHQDNNSRFTIVIKNDGDGLVGWPPIKSWRKEACFHNHNHGHGHRTVGNGSGGGGRGSSNHHHSTFVKVKMEGVGIARKIDLSLHHSFRTLADTLMDMFDKCQMDSNNYKLTYQDREGDWLLAQDVPWRTFIRSVQRLKLVKKSD
ncbi:PREDICTED: auxin-responsive [Prunus dulcis]|uniref:Auxin-responsive protein n=1 Tax=Prunus dulcis TaxID=3755 RepID=A0A5E4E7T9_PRUDU|nr:auxin-responsive protein IAA20-like [Prunus dulcis]VVA10791.1 PREDICTED: auxin-responsive [Prunus dulcis]